MVGFPSKILYHGSGISMLLSRLAASALAAAASVSISLHPASAAPFSTPCVPGVTAERCRGTFWETGKLYKKDDDGAAYTTEEYTAALQRLDELRAQLGTLRVRSDQGEVKKVGEEAAAARIALRQTGLRICASLAGDERVDSRRSLFALVRQLDDVDAVSLNSPAESSTAPGFTRLSLLLDSAIVRFDEFRRALPLTPDEDALL